MLNLALAISCTTLINLALRVFGDKRGTKNGAFFVQYIVCVFFGFVFLGDKAEFFSNISKGPKEGFMPALIMAAISGMLYFIGITLQTLNIQKNGLVLASVFMKMGLLVTVLIAVVLFKQVPSTKQIVGIFFAIAAIIIFNIKKSGDEKEPEAKKNAISKGGFILLMALLLEGGVSDSMVSVYDHFGSPKYSDDYLFLLFFFALIFSFIAFLFEKKKLTKGDIICGLAIGFPNYFNSKFLMASLKSLPAVIAYPINSVMVIVLVSFFGVLVFKESFTKQRFLGLMVAIAAVLLLS